jgi:hypothetical protein
VVVWWRSLWRSKRHGLSIPVHSDPALSEEVERLALEIAGTAAFAELKDLARAVAEAEVDLRRVRYVRHQLLCNALADASLLGNDPALQDATLQHYKVPPNWQPFCSGRNSYLRQTGMRSAHFPAASTPFWRWTTQGLTWFVFKNDTTIDCDNCRTKQNSSTFSVMSTTKLVGMHI